MKGLFVTSISGIKYGSPTLRMAMMGEYDMFRVVWCAAGAGAGVWWDRLRLRRGKARGGSLYIMGDSELLARRFRLRDV